MSELLIANVADGTSIKPGDVAYILAAEERPWAFTVDEVRVSDDGSWRLHSPGFEVDATAVFGSARAAVFADACRASRELTEATRRLALIDGHLERLAKEVSS